VGDLTGLSDLPEDRSAVADPEPARFDSSGTPLGIINSSQIPHWVPVPRVEDTDDLYQEK